jgi:hypothetical protein
MEKNMRKDNEKKNNKTAEEAPYLQTPKASAQPEAQSKRISNPEVIVQ